jgi:site-specific DNA recombinase
MTARAPRRRARITSSTLRVPRVPAEHAMLAGIRRELLSDAAFAAYRRAFVARVRQSQPDGARVRKALADAEQVRDNVLKAIRAGIITPSTKAELERAERAVEAAKAALAAPKPETHLPRLRERWQRLADTLADRSRTTAELREVLQGLIGTATVKKTDGALVAEIAPSSQLAMVAGAGSVRYLTEPLRITITAAESRA